ncbi:MAG TPA: S53 family peptidase [Steroidobacteraceae bacterium]|nr:S53 family peptidase [Steroidobacteraceae bacterium]
MTQQSMRKRVIVFAGFVALTTSSLLAGDLATAAPTVRVGSKVTSQHQQPTSADCLAVLGVPCYGPADIRKAYGLDPLIEAGFTGAGETIVLVESYGSPTIKADLEQFDSDFGLPAPPALTVLAPLGPIPPLDTTQPDQVNWAFETTLDVEWAHAMAPGAAIVVLESPVDETEGVQGLPEFLELEKYALEHHMGKIISQSWGATENTLFREAAGPQGPRVIADYTAFYTLADFENVTVLASSGDGGSQNAATYSQALGAPTSFYTFPTVIFPASSPLVTAVGGTTLHLDASANYEFETVWNDDSISAGAGGGGISQIFGIPGYQRFALPPHTRQQLAGHRGIPDISYNADDFNSAILVYVSFLGPDNAGYYLIGGTSEGAPQWAGIVADLNQYAGVHLGFLNPKLYLLGALGQFADIGRDITTGNNAYGGVPGYSATKGWDLATGWGTPNLKALPGRFSDFFLLSGAPK